MAQYTWNGTNTASSILTTNESKIHILSVKDAFGCLFADSIEILTKPSSPFSLGPDTLVCPGDNYTIFGPSALKFYKWNNVSSTQAFKVINTPGTYWAEAFNSFGCPSYDTVTITTKANPDFSLGKDTGFCDVLNYTLSGPSNMAAYEWSTNDTIQSIAITTPGTYTLAVVAANGCTNKDSITVSLNPSPVINLGTTTKIPISGVLTLSPGTSFVSYTWSNGKRTSSIQVTDTGRYNVTVIDSNGCSGYAEIHVNKTASIGYIDGNRYVVYPNPAQNIVNISGMTGDSEETIRIIDPLGKTILDRRSNGLIDAIDVSAIPAGLYHIIITKNGAWLNLSLQVLH
jgi:hypothetical protein